MWGGVTFLACRFFNDRLSADGLPAQSHKSPKTPDFKGFSGLYGRGLCIKDETLIDPPYNTGEAYEYYDDNLEHSIWLNLMRARLQLLRGFLSEDGFFCCQIVCQFIPTPHPLPRRYHHM